MALGGWLDLLVPPACLRCGAEVAGRPALCAACFAAVPAPDEPPGRAAIGPGALAACAARGVYEGEVEAWVRRFKYPGRREFPWDPAPEAILSELLVDVARELSGPWPDRIVPVPLHPRRLRERGFDQAALLADRLGRRLHVVRDPGALVRVRDTPSQTGLDARARRHNVAGAFQARPGRVPGRCIWLVDDVVTTGATLAEAARNLRRAGASRVVGLCAAATPFVRKGA